MEKNLKKYMCVCVQLNYFAVHLKLTQHCKLTTLQFHSTKLSLQDKQPQIQWRFLSVHL